MNRSIVGLMLAGAYYRKLLMATITIWLNCMACGREGFRQVRDHEDIRTIACPHCGAKALEAV